MGKSRQLRAADLRAVLDLVGELGELPRDADVRMPRLLAGVRRLLGARYAACGYRVWKDLSQPQFLGTWDDGWDSPDERAATAKYFQSEYAREPMLGPLNKELGGRFNGQSVAVLSQDHFEEREWSMLAHVQEVLRPLRVNHAVQTMYTKSGTCVIGGFLLFREWGGRKYGDGSGNCWRCSSGRCGGCSRTSGRTTRPPGRGSRPASSRCSRGCSPATAPNRRRAGWG